MDGAVMSSESGGADACQNGRRLGNATSQKRVLFATQALVGYNVTALVSETSLIWKGNMKPPTVHASQVRRSSVLLALLRQWLRASTVSEAITISSVTWWK